jgi:hypothetical protein
MARKEVPMNVLKTCVALLLTCGLAQASEVVVPNFSFETPVFDGNEPQPQVATGWTPNSLGGVDPYSSGFTASDDGVQHHYLNLPDYGGSNPSYTESNATLIGTAKPGTYTLTVAAGRRASTTDGTYVIELRAGGVVIATETVNDPYNTYANDSWHDMTAIAELDRISFAIGQDLTIRLIATENSGGDLSQGEFDTVRLDFVSSETAPVPTLSNWLLSVLALLLATFGLKQVYGRRKTRAKYI